MERIEGVLRVRRAEGSGGVPAAGIIERRGGAIAGAVVLAAVATAIAFPISICIWDDSAYTVAAQNIARGRLPDGDYFSCRTGTVLPMALLFRLFGDGDPVYRIFPLLVYALNGWLAYALTARFLGKAEGLLACVFSLVLPIAFFQSNVPNTDAVLALWTDLAFLALIGARARSDGRLPALGAVASGAFLGFAYLTKETGIFAMVPLLVLGLGGRRRWTLVAGLLAGSAAVFAGECAGMLLAWNDILARFRFLSIMKPTPPGQETPLTFARALFDPSYPENHPIGLQFAVALAALPAGVFALKGAGRPLVIWFAVLFAMIAATFTSLHPGIRFLDSQARYLMPVALPACSLGALAFVRLLRARPSIRLPAAGALVLLLALSGFLCVTMVRDASREVSGLRLALRWLSGRPAAGPVYMDYGTGRAATAIAGLDAASRFRVCSDIGEARGPGSIIFSNDSLSPKDRDRFFPHAPYDPASIGARLVVRYTARSPWSLQAALGLRPRSTEEKPIFSIWEAP